MICHIGETVSKKFKGLRCAYCAVREAVTGDHIFAREFFLPSARANLPKAPICAECNNEKSKLEHYLTTVLPFGSRHPDASENLASMVPTRLRRNVRLHRHLKQKQKVVFAPDKDGQTEDTIAIPFEGEKLERLFSMIARGLIWYHWHVYLEDGYEVQTRTVTALGLRHYDEVVSQERTRPSQPEPWQRRVRLRRCQATDDPAITVWKFSVYGGLASYEDEISPETRGSHLISIAAPSSAFRPAKLGGDA